MTKESIEQIGWAIETCFDDWLAARGGDGSIEIKNAVKHVEHLFVSNEFSERVMTLRFHNIRGLEPEDSVRVRDMLAYRKLDKEGNIEEFWVLPSVSIESSARVST